MPQGLNEAQPVTALRYSKERRKTGTGKQPQPTSAPGVSPDTDPHTACTGRLRGPRGTEVPGVGEGLCPGRQTGESWEEVLPEESREKTGGDPGRGGKGGWWVNCCTYSSLRPLNSCPVLSRPRTGLLLWACLFKENCNAESLLCPGDQR